MGRKTIMELDKELSDWVKYKQRTFGSTAQDTVARILRGCMLMEGYSINLDIFFSKLETEIAIDKKASYSIHSKDNYWEGYREALDNVTSMIDKIKEEAQN